MVEYHLRTLGKEHLTAFVAIAFISILSRRLKRLVVQARNSAPDVYKQTLSLLNVTNP